MVCALGCSSNSSTSEETLTNAEDWVIVEDDEDPFLEERGSETIVCSKADFRAEGEVVEVDTSSCNFITLRQRIPVALDEGDELHMSLWWQRLASLEETTGHIAVLLDDEMVVEERMPIPSEADARDIVFTLNHALPQGTPLYFHVHNHGSNSWSLGPILHHR